MADSRADDVIRDQGQLQGVRANWEGHWAEIGERVLTRQRDFKQERRQGGEKLNERIFDSTAPLALERFGAAMELVLTPRNQRWHELSVGFDDLKEDPAVRQWLFDVTSILFNVRNAPTSGFASQMSECYLGLGAFGTAGLYVDDALGQGIRYRAIALAELFVSENFQGMVDKVHRKYELTARQAKQKWESSGALPDSIIQAAEKEPERKFEFIHCVKPREEVEWNRNDYRGMKFASYYVCMEGRSIISEGGFRTFPYPVSRYVTGPREVYGRSPAMTVLADIKGVNEQKKTLLRTGQLIAEPPVLLTDDGCLTAFKMKAGALNYGALSPDGTELAKPFQVGANMPINQEMLQSDRTVINDAFLVTLFQILVEQPDMTATQAMLRAQEKGELLAPTMGRQQSELLGTIIVREIDILAHAGVLPPMPPQLQERGGGVNITYCSPLAKAQRADEGAAIMNLFGEIVSLAQADPSAVHGLKVPEAVAELGRISGVPASLLRTPEEIQAITAQAQQAQQMQNMLAAAGPASMAAKNLMQAQAMAGAAPSQAAPDILPGR